jgi:hypothetical protein
MRPREGFINHRKLLKVVERMISVKQYGDREMLAKSKCANCGCPCPCTCYIPPQPAAAYLFNYTSNAAASAFSFAAFIDIHQA